MRRSRVLSSPERQVGNDTWITRDSHFRATLLAALVPGLEVSATGAVLTVNPAHKKKEKKSKKGGGEVSLPSLTSGLCSWPMESLLSLPIVGKQVLL